MDEIDQIYDEYEIASQISQTDFSHLTIDDFAMVEYDSEGAPYGMVMGVPVAINTKPPAKEPMQPEQPAQAEPSGSIGQDIDRGLVRGVQKASEALGDTLPLLGTPVDLVNKGLREVGELIGVDLGSDKPVLGSEMIRDGVQAVIEFGNNLIPQQANEAYAEYVNQPPSSPVVQGLVEEITKFGVQAVTPAMYLKAFTVMSPFVRGLAWGGIADFINAQPSDEGAISAITKMVAGATPEERGAVANAIMQVVEKQESDPLIISKAREALDGMILGGSIEKGVELLVKAARQIPVDQLRQRIVDAGARADDRLKSTMRGTTLSANPVGAMGDMAVSAAGRLARTDDEIAPVFHSAVLNAVDALPMEKGGGDQMRAMIAKGEGVKAEEMAWIGLDDFLKGKKSVTKQEVRDYVEANQVQVEEVVRADEGVTQEIGYLRRRYEMMVKGYGDYRELPPSLRMERAEKMLAEIEAMEASNVAGRPKFGPDRHPELSLPGGENYREVLLRLPDKKAERLEQIDNRLRRIATTIEDAGDMSRYDNLKPEFKAAVYKERDRLLEEQANLLSEKEALNAKSLFRLGHFDESNVLAHLRLNDRTGPDGEKILFIEEIQSDWHQKGRKQGYKGQEKGLISELPEGYTVESGMLPPMPSEQSGNQFWRVLDPDGNPVTAQSFNRESAINAAINDINNVIRGTTASPVPDAPLKKNWHEMSFRRVARMAAEEGYDRIAWTPGKMQAERYNLSTRISEIHLSGSNFKAYDLNGDEAISRTGVRPEDLPELIGKEAADRLMSQEAKNGLRSLTGQELEVGGEGMKGFYDKMLKNYASKWGKKFGSKVGVTKIPAVYEGRLPDDQLRSLKDAQLGGGHEVWSMPVTPKMKDSVLKKGVPFFGAAGATAVGIQDDKQPAS